MFNEGYNKENLLSYKGPITVNLVSFMGNYLKSMLKIDHMLLKRVFRIFIELTQNVSYYSAEVIEMDSGINSGAGWFEFNELKESYKITTGNLILKADGIKLSSNCNEINTLNDKQLRELKRKTRGQAMIKDVGAHIGLIQISILSQSRLNYKITELNDNLSFFTISVNIEK